MNVPEASTIDATATTANDRDHTTSKPASGDTSKKRQRDEDVAGEERPAKKVDAGEE